MIKKLNLNVDINEELKLLANNEKLIYKITDEKNIEKKHLNKVNQLLANSNLKTVCENVINDKYIQGLTYEKFSMMYDTLKDFFIKIKETKNDIDVDVFFSKGGIINITKLRKEFFRLDRHKIFPKFNFRKLDELFKLKKLEIIPQDGSSEKPIEYNMFIVKKYLFAIIQMVVNEMDLLVIFTGSEGMGKSCACSQDINLVYWILKELDLIKYKYKIKDIWHNSLENFTKAEDDFFEEKFRIIGLDEGNELNRKSWQDELVKTFFQRLRRERFNQRIKFVCLPQLGELQPDIVLSRANFIFNMQSVDKIDTGTLNKGFCNFYIIPRNIIYSHTQKRNITRNEIVDQLGLILDDKKKYYKKLPKELLIYKFKKPYRWGFKKSDYDKNLKDTNQTFSLSNGYKMTEYQAYCYYATRPPIKDWLLDKNIDGAVYSQLMKTERGISRIFESDPNKLLKYEHMILRKRKKGVGLKKS